MYETASVINIDLLSVVTIFYVTQLVYTIKLYNQWCIFFSIKFFKVLGDYNYDIRLFTI